MTGLPEAAAQGGMHAYEPYLSHGRKHEGREMRFEIRDWSISHSLRQSRVLIFGDPSGCPCSFSRYLFANIERVGMQKGSCVGEAERVESNNMEVCPSVGFQERLL